MNFLWLRGCCEAAVTAECEAMASLGMRLSGDVSAASAEMSFWLHPSGPSSAPFQNAPSRCPVATTAPAASREGQCRMANKMCIFPLPLWKGSSEAHCPHHFFPSLFPAQSCFSLSSGAASPSLLLPSAQSWSVCAQQHPGNPAQAPHTWAPSGDETELGVRAGLPGGPPCH